MKAFSFIHVSDLHLGYQQYGLEARREDFERAFDELTARSIELKPDFVIMSGDIFHQPRPSNVTLENAVRHLSRLDESGIEVLTVDGSHDSAPNNVTGTILNPLDSAGLVHHLPRHEGAFWQKPDHCYVYGVPNFRTRHRTEEMLPLFLQQNMPKPDPSLFNIFVFHMGLELPGVTPPYVEAEASPDDIPDGFDYYAGGHIHKSHRQEFKTGTLVYSGSLETTDYSEAKFEKGFYHVEVDELKNVKAQFVKLETPRKFTVLEQDFTGVVPSKITENTIRLVRSADEDGLVIVPILKGILPAEASRGEVDVAGIRASASKALFVHPIIQLRESEVSEETVRSIFESAFTDLKTKAFQYFVEIFSERYSGQQAKGVARAALDLVEPMAKKQEDKVKQVLEGFSK